MEMRIEYALGILAIWFHLELSLFGKGQLKLNSLSNT